jgi:hypothetical protein
VVAFRDRTQIVPTYSSKLEREARLVWMCSIELENVEFRKRAEIAFVDDLPKFRE